MSIRDLLLEELKRLKRLNNLLEASCNSSIEKKEPEQIINNINVMLKIVDVYCKY